MNRIGSLFSNIFDSKTFDEMDSVCNCCSCYVSFGRSGQSLPYLRIPKFSPNNGGIR